MYMFLFGVMENTNISTKFLKLRNLNRAINTVDGIVHNFVNMCLETELIWQWIQTRIRFYYKYIYVSQI